LAYSLRSTLDWTSDSPGWRLAWTAKDVGIHTVDSQGSTGPGEIGTSLGDTGRGLVDLCRRLVDGEDGAVVALGQGRFLQAKAINLSSHRLGLGLLVGYGLSGNRSWLGERAHRRNDGCKAATRQPDAARREGCTVHNEPKW
jgi:hypothetical protein